MKMETEDFRTLLTELRRDVLPVFAPEIKKQDPMQVTLADAWEIRNLDKIMIKKLREEEVLALIAYGQEYIEQYREGKYLYKKGSVDKDGRVSTKPGRTLLADFDEAGAYNDIVLIVKMLKAELNHKR